MAVPAAAYGAVCLCYKINLSVVHRMSLASVVGEAQNVWHYKGTLLTCVRSVFPDVAAGQETHCDGCKTKHTVISV